MGSVRLEIALYPSTNLEQLRAVIGWLEHREADAIAHLLS